MRMMSIILPAALVAAPASAQAPALAPSAVESVLADPATADRVAGAMHGLSKALLNLPVGEVEAAIDGRPATAADKRRTVRDIGRANDPNFEQSLDRRIAGSRVALRSGIQAMAKAVPAMTRAISDMSREMEQVLGNLPRPDYPDR